MGTDPVPLLWGPWEAVFDAGGSCMVVLADRDATRPHLYVFADPLPGDPIRWQRNRRAMCHSLASWLTGSGPRPPWLDDFAPRGEVAAEAITGAMLVATGPWVRRRGSRGVWRQDRSQHATADRRRLMAVLLGKDAA